jgi:predicted RNase H-like HicB family nuclease
MICNVILSKENEDYIARVKDWPEVVVKESTREKAITGVKSKLLEYLNENVELIQIEVPVAGATGNPWVDKFGWFKDDPTFDDLESEIASYRQQIDIEEGHTD